MARLRHVVLLVLFVAVSLSKQDRKKPGYAKCPDDISFSSNAKRGEPLSRCSLQLGDKGCQTGLHCCQEQRKGGPGLCFDLTKCGASTCNSNGACAELVGGGILCDCNPGFTGDNCETGINYCDSSPCENGGTCSEETAGFTCACDASWTGTTCCTDVIECEASTCNGNGACVELVGDGIECTCNPGFKGVNCETDINYCDSSPCENGGTCTEETTGFTCACGASWTGTICGTDVTECGASTCNSNGACVELVGGGILCDCNPGFLGDNCETDINYCDSSPCENGGTCSEETTGFTCACGPYWKGTTCGTADCPAEWIYASGLNKCLKILTSEVDFATARTECKTAGGRLAWFTTRAAVDEAYSLLDMDKDDKDYWVDISLQTKGDCDSFATPDGVIIPSNSALWAGGYPHRCYKGLSAVVVLERDYVEWSLRAKRGSLCEIGL